MNLKRRVMDISLVFGLIIAMGGIIIAPETSTVLYPGDILIALGTRCQLEAMAQLVYSPQSSS